MLMRARAENLCSTIGAAENNGSLVFLFGRFRLRGLTGFSDRIDDLKVLKHPTKRGTLDGALLHIFGVAQQDGQLTAGLGDSQQLRLTDRHRRGDGAIAAACASRAILPAGAEARDLLAHREDRKSVV